MRKGAKIALGIVGGIIAAAGIVMAVNHEATRVVIHNVFAGSEKLDDSKEWSGGTSYENLQYSDVSENDYMHLYVPDTQETPPLIVMVHGGGFVFNDLESRQAQFMYRYFRDHGYACATVNYRLAQEAPFPAGLEDVKAAVRFLRSHAEEYGYSTDHVSIFGESAGGYLASMTALTNDEEFMSVEYIGQKEDEEKGEAASAKVDVLVDYYGVVEFSGLSGQNSDWETLGVPPLVFKIANSWMNPKEMEGFNDCESYWLRQNVKEMSDEELQKVCVPM